jgi:hypothetical protein
VWNAKPFCERVDTWLRKLSRNPGGRINMDGGIRNSRRGRELVIQTSSAAGEALRHEKCPLFPQGWLSSFLWFPAEITQTNKLFIPAGQALRA